jgi:hypothetical protein
MNRLYTVYSEILADTESIKRWEEMLRCPLHLQLLKAEGEGAPF